MKVGVFISSGLGNAILLVPLLKELRKECSVLTGIFTSPYNCEGLFIDSGLFDTILTIKDKKAKWLKLCLKYTNHFDKVYLDNFASTRKIFLISHIISKKIIAQKMPLNLPGPVIKKTEIINPVKCLHSAVQNLRLLNPEFTNTGLKESDFYFQYKSNMEPPPALKRCTFIAVQIGSSNSIKSYKNWPVENWRALLELILKKYPGLYCVLLGEPVEMQLASNLTKPSRKNIISLVGKTSVHDLPGIIGNCRMFLGADSGLMHLAAALDKPTFTIWGPSDFNLYGYHKINPEKHKIIYQDVNCRPCNSWLAPNTTRVKKPEDCPDFMCMNTLSPAAVFSNFIPFGEKFIHADH